VYHAGSHAFAQLTEKPLKTEVRLFIAVSLTQRACMLVASNSFAFYLYCCNKCGDESWRRAMRADERHACMRLLPLNHHPRFRFAILFIPATVVTSVPHHHFHLQQAGIS